MPNLNTGSFRVYHWKSKKFQLVLRFKTSLKMTLKSDFNHGIQINRCVCAWVEKKRYKYIYIYIYIYIRVVIQRNRLSVDDYIYIYIYIYIVIHRQTVSLYHNKTDCLWMTIYIYSHLWMTIYIYGHPQIVCFVVSQLFGVQDTQDASSWDRNPSNFTLDLVSNWSTISATYVSSGIMTLVFAFVCFHFALSGITVLNS